MPAQEPERVQDFIDANRHEDLYLGVASRIQIGEGALSNCGQIHALWVDIDFKLGEEATLRRNVDAFAIPPNIVVRSGGGRHLYWLLEEPVSVADHAVELRDVLRRLAFRLGGDVKAGEPARILRLPGTTNYKYDPPRPVELAFIDTTMRMPINYFNLLLPQTPSSSHTDSLADSGASKKYSSGGLTFTHSQLPSRIGPGQRNNLLYAVGRSLLLKGYDASTIAAVLQDENRLRCQPPLDNTELRMLIQNVLRQPNRL